MKEVLKRKQEVLERVSDEFETVHVEVTSLAAELHAFEMLKGNPLLIEECRSRISAHFESLDKSCVVLQRAEGRLLLIGITSGAAILARYRALVSELIANAGTPENRSKEAVLKKSLPLCDLHTEFYGWVTNEYCAQPEKGFAQGYSAKPKAN